jgi:hypothetical protein
VDGDQHSEASVAVAMTYEWPIFTEGLYGKANASVCNAWTQSARIVLSSAEALDWANRTKDGFDQPDRWLAKVTVATGISSNRWSYTFVPVIISGTTTANLSGTGQAGSGALNLREMNNTTILADGSPLASGVTIGPVGSTWGGSSWSTSSLTGIVEMNVEHKADGSVAYWFSSPNPGRCAT